MVRRKEMISDEALEQIEAQALPLYEHIAERLAPASTSAES
jgi:hypothetical protein